MDVGQQASPGQEDCSANPHEGGLKSHVAIACGPLEEIADKRRCRGHDPGHCHPERGSPDKQARQAVENQAG
ncbi:hypothetical protein ABIA26_005571 [Sinorhizobium fredii]